MHSSKAAEILASGIWPVKRPPVRKTNGSTTSRERIIQRLLWYTEVQPNGCWHWTRVQTGCGYAQIGIDGKLISVHRLSYELFVGPIPDGMVVCHKCDVRHCICPDHLWIGTYQDNTDDMMKKGRCAVIGSNCKKSKLTDEKVIQIRKLKQSGISHSKIASLYGIHFTTVSDIVRGKIWKHLLI